MFQRDTISLFSFQMLKCIELDEKLKSMDQEITVNPQFVQKVRRCSTTCGVITNVTCDSICTMCFCAGFAFIYSFRCFICVNIP